MLTTALFFGSGQEQFQELPSQLYMFFERHPCALRQDSHGAGGPNNVLANCQGLPTLQVLKVCNVFGLIQAWLVKHNHWDKSANIERYPKAFAQPQQELSRKQQRLASSTEDCHRDSCSVIPAHRLGVSPVQKKG